MSTSDPRPALFDQWLPAEYRRRGDFTVLVVLVGIDTRSIELLSSTFMNVIGDETRWREVRQLFQSSETDWNGAAFFPVDSVIGPVPNDMARTQLRALEEKVRADRRVLNGGHFFDRKGRRLKVEEIVH
ncbi:hypothetical protein [Aerobium aerolatum]|uniref:Uncharacterized protein n=1 Tax=Aquamicrobium aerolatum DSM 21857 TaxID=1121003 RepID=A0A1I3ICQ4_9HYPH|nr:hypothetical protein [Aquamicrobium aerolatum]SFI45543.1 hypothetical protein SAMN03080618_00508 [Aquamicrobium aerolatum DSM 21857]